MNLPNNNERVDGEHSGDDTAVQALTLPVLGVNITDVSMQQAIEMMAGWIRSRDGRTRSVFIVNAHTLNLTYEDPDYRDVLASADAVFGDGTGVRWAARLKGVRLKDNLVGTDLLPAFFRGHARSGFRYFLLGAAPDTTPRAARRLQDDFPGICLAGHHHGYFSPQETPAIIRLINTAAPDMLMVAMGNPKQEQWIHAHRAALRVPVCIGVGGLFDHWAGNLQRASQWVRAAGIEWMQILVQQPYKWRRYLLGNPQFIVRVVTEARAERSGSVVHTGTRW